MIEITVQECFTPAQETFLNKVYAPGIINDWWLQWLSEADVFIRQYIDADIEKRETIKSVTRLYMQYKAFSVPNYEEVSERKMIALIDVLKTLRENQKNNKNVNVSRVVYKKENEKFPDKFWGN